MLTSESPASQASMPVPSSIDVERAPRLPIENTNLLSCPLNIAKNGCFIICLIIFSCFDAAFIGYIAQFFIKHGYYWVVILSQIFFVGMIISLLAIHFYDPGYLLPAVSREAPEEKRIPEPTDAPAILNPIKEMGQFSKYCVYCHQYRPRNANHCTICNGCIIDPDHHCPWIGNCISRQNYSIFIAFLVFISIYSLFTFGCLWVRVILEHNINKDQKHIS